MSTLLELISSYQLTTLEWVLSFLAAFIIGLSKSGIKGIAIIIITIMAIIFGGKASTGIVVPMFIVGDIFAVIYYNKHTQWRYLKKLLPWMIAGVLLGVWFGKDLPETLFKNGMAVIILITVAMMFWWDRLKSTVIPDNSWFAGSMGMSAGFTTMVGNLAGAFSNLYFLAMRLPKDHFIGTAAWLFFIINLFKMPFHIWVWETVTLKSFALNIFLLPGILLGLFVGVRVVKMINENYYRKMILVLTALGALAIFFK